MVCQSSSLRRSKKSSYETDLLCVCVFFYYLQEEFTTLEEKASNVLQDYEKAQVSCNVKLGGTSVFLSFFVRKR